MTTRETLLGGAAIVIGFIAAATGYMKAFAAWLRSFLVVSVWINDNALRAVTSYLGSHGKRAGGIRVYAAEYRYIREQGHGELIPFEELNRDSSRFWFRRQPVWVTKANKGLCEPDVAFRLSVIRGLLNPERLIIDACAWAGAGFRHIRSRHRVIHHHGRQLVLNSERVAIAESPGPGRHLGSKGSATRLIGHTMEDIEPPATVESLDEMVMTSEVRDLTGSIRRWFADREWCIKHSVPWRAGFLYEGEPGSGKTSHARCVAVELDLPVHVFDLATMSNEDLRQAWMHMVSEAPCMALVEDIDRVFDGDKNITTQSSMLTSGGLTFNALLNAIDGIERHDGVLLVVTTNHIDKVDPAIKDRKGRVDQVVHFGSLDHASRATLARRIVDDPALAERLAIEHTAMSTSAFVAACCDVARRARYTSQVDLGPMRTSAP